MRSPPAIGAVSGHHLDQLCIVRLAVNVQLLQFVKIEQWNAIEQHQFPFCFHLEQNEGVQSSRLAPISCMDWFLVISVSIANVYAQL